MDEMPTPSTPAEAPTPTAPRVVLFDVHTGAPRDVTEGEARALLDDPASGLVIAPPRPVQGAPLVTHEAIAAAVLTSAPATTADDAAVPALPADAADANA